MKISMRSGGVAAILAGIGYVLQAIMGLIQPQTEVFSGTWDYVLEVIFIGALIATMFALPGLHAAMRGYYGKAGAAGFWLAMLGTALMTISAIATLLAGQNALGPVFLGGMLLALLGYFLLGISILRVRTLRPWGGLLLIFGFPLSVFLNTLGGGILFGLTWLGVGYMLLKGSPASQAVNSLAGHSTD
jgi:hypothetical protein